jgi:hypothetical protein
MKTNFTLVELPNEKRAAVVLGLLVVGMIYFFMKMIKQPQQTILLQQEKMQ